MSTVNPGMIALLGSGETAASAQAIYHAVMTRYVPPVQVAVLETPAGFELNSDRVAGRVADYVRERLQNLKPEISVIPARRRGTPYSPDDPVLLEPLLHADVIFFGPGSPTYAVQQLRGSLAWQMIQARHSLGAAIVMASAATLAISAQTIPVYEIYKVGQEVHWQTGLNFFGARGLDLVFVPHWDNNEGGADIDTSRCWMGLERFAKLRAMLPPDAKIVGIDEHTALLVDCQSGLCRVMGRSGVTLVRGDEETRWADGQEFSLHALGNCQMPAPGHNIAPPVWARISRAHAAAQTEPAPSAEVLALVQEREGARARKEWSTADTLRQRIQALGWQVKDTPQGSQLTPA